MTTPLTAHITVYAPTYAAAIEQAGQAFDAYFGTFHNWKLVEHEARAQTTAAGVVLGWGIDITAEATPRP